MVKNTGQRKSMDGMVPAAKRVRIMKQTAQDAREKFISVRPAAAIDRPIARRGEVEIVKGMVIPKLTQLRVPAVLKKDVVVKLPRRWTIRTSILLIVQYLALAAIAVAAGYSTGIGQWFVLAYAVYALVTRQDSRLSFGIALFVLVSVPFFQAINQPGVANNMAVYVYELLVVGTVQALIELRRSPADPAVTGNPAS